MRVMEPQDPNPSVPNAAESSPISGAASKEQKVHEDTLRKWEKAGLMEPVSLPDGLRKLQTENVDQPGAASYDHLIPDRLK